MSERVENEVRWRMCDGHENEKSGISRRGFLQSLGAGAALAAAGPATLARTDGAQESDVWHDIALMVNGRRHQLAVESRWSLLFVLRDKLGLTGTKMGCDRGECGACTVLIDDIPRYSCMTLAVEAAGHEITTIEGLMRGEELGSVQRAFVEYDAFQCGYCTSGQIMAAEGLLRRSPDPDEASIRQAMAGNLCRCGAYPNIVRAIQAAAAERRGGAA